MTRRSPLPTLPVRPANGAGVAAFLFRRDPDLDRVLLLLRAGGGFEGKWCPVAGRVEPGETAEYAVGREIGEETGLRPTGLRATGSWQIRDHSGGATRIDVFGGFVPDDATVTLNYEHSDFRWFAVPEAARVLPIAQQRRAMFGVARDLAVRGA